jgi:hypothetical protein
MMREEERLLGCNKLLVASTAQGYAMVTAEARCRLQGALLLRHARIQFDTTIDVFLRRL